MSRFTLMFQVRTLAWAPFRGFNTLSWTVQDDYGHVIDFGWGRRKTAYSDGNNALARAYHSQTRPRPYALDDRDWT